MDVSNFSIMAVLISGMLMFFSPCVFPLLPIYFTILEKDNKKVRNSILFILGLSSVFVSIGFGLGIIGSYLYSPIARIIASILIILMGLQQLGLFNLNILNRTKKFNINFKVNNSGLESFLLGFGFSLGWTPCIGPILGTIFLYAAGSSSSLFGALLLIIFIIGFTLPFIIFSIFYDKLSKKIKLIKNNLENIKKISAIIIIIMGILLLLNKL